MTRDDQFLIDCIDERETVLLALLRSCLAELSPPTREYVNYQDELYRLRSIRDRLVVSGEAKSAK